jgi:thiol-disulfide isomerase/thioredoxin
MRIRTLLLPLCLALGISAQAGAPVPRPSKEFTIATPQGQQILFSSLKGKVCVVQFLFTWCPHCQAFSQVLTQLNTEYGPRGFQALGVAFDDDDGKMPLKDKVTGYTKQYAAFPVGVSSRTPVLSYLGISELERIGVPQIVVIDRKGVIREQSPSTGGGPLGDPAHLKPLIESLLAEGAAPKSPAKSGDTNKTSGKKSADKKTSE